MSPKAISMLTAIALLPVAAFAQSADPRLLAMSCAGCHGPEGHSPGAVPSLYGRSETVLAAALRSFRDGHSPSTVMGRVAKGYSDAEITAMAREIATHWK